MSTPLPMATKNQPSPRATEITRTALPTDQDGLHTEEFMVNMGPQHPSTHGVLRLILKLDGEVVKDVIPDVGYLHRSIEKIGESRMYAQFIPFTDRMDYIASMYNNMTFAYATEKLADIEVPERAHFIRVLIMELNRIASHLLWFGTFALDLGAVTPFLYAFKDRESIIDIIENTCGARLMFNYIRIGGVSFDIPDNFIQTTRDFCAYFKKRLPELEGLLTNNIIFKKRTQGIGVISQALAIENGLSGPMLRCTGLAKDLRKTEPYAVYDRFDFNVMTETAGDVYARYLIRVREMAESVKIIEQALDQMPGGETKAKLPAMFKPKPAEAYAAIESPRGILGAHLIGDGTTKPYRVKLRTPSFSNISILPDITRGHKVADVVAILGSIDIVMPDIDR